MADVSQAAGTDKPSEAPKSAPRVAPQKLPLRPSSNNPSLPPTRVMFFARGDHVELAEQAMRDLGDQYSEVVSYGGSLYGYRNGIFERLHEKTLERIVRSYAGAPYGNGEKPKALRVNASTLTGVARIIRVELDDPQFFESAPVGIPFVDRFIRVDADGLHTQELRAEHRARHRYPFALPNAVVAPLFLCFLDAVFRDDPDRSEKIAAVQEFMGAAIVGIATTYERALMPYGPGANGKTRLCEIIKATMPPGSVVALPPSLMGDQYSRSKLADARLNVHPDIPDDALVSDVKGIVTGELTHARDPGSGAICFVPRCAHVFGCNKLPHTRDTSDGFWRHWLIITMTRDFRKDAQKDPDIVAKILPETPSIVRWGLEGAVRLLGRADYTLPTSHGLALDRWRGKEDAVRAFIETRTRATVGNERGTLSSELCKAFNEWIVPYGGECKSLRAFGSEMKDRGYPGTHTSGGECYARVLLP